jgi:NAD(P)-dependent dehydrogenase (short-subunit alcohol dehydrogenase family)
VEPRPAVEQLFGLHGSTALVTGASRGIGAHVARVLDAAGAQVVLCARDVVALHELSGSFEHDPVTVRADLADPDAPERLAASLGELVDKVDIVVNNAGMHRPERATAMAAADWDRTMSLNLRSAFLLARAFAPGMAARGWGKVVNVSSVLGLVGDTHAAAYVTSKAGLIGLTRALAVEWTEQGVGVNALCPGWIETDMTEGLHGDDRFDARVRRRTPARRWGTVQDLTGALLYLCGHASDFTAGQTLVVDGGLTASW